MHKIHFGRSTLKVACFQLSDGLPTRKKYIKSSKRLQYFSTLTTTKSNTFTVCNSAKIFSKLHAILSEMLKKAQVDSLYLKQNIRSLEISLKNTA